MFKFADNVFRKFKFEDRQAHLDARAVYREYRKDRAINPLYGAYMPHNLQHINNQVLNTQNSNYPLQIGQVTPYIEPSPIPWQNQILPPPPTPPSHQYPDAQGSIIGGQNSQEGNRYY